MNFLLQLSNSYNKLIDEEDFVIGDIVRKFKGDDCSDAYVRGGPREITHFDPQKVRAAIVTCGGLCPGLNNQIPLLKIDSTYLMPSTASASYK